MVFERPEFSVGHIKLVDHLVALCTHLCVDDDVDVAQELLALGSEVDHLHLFQVDDVPILVGHDLARLSALPQRLLSILQSLLAEDRDALVEVLHRKDDTRTASQSVHFCASISQTSQELLHKANLVDDVQMAQPVYVLQHG